MKNNNKESFKTFTCVCGSSMQILCFSHLQGEEDEKLNCTVCLFCHELTTGKNKIVDDSGRLSKFMKKWNK